MRFFIILLFINISLLASSKIITKGQSGGMEYQVEIVAQNIDGIPWGMEFINKDLLFVNLKDGQMFLLNLKSNTQTPVSGMPQTPLSSGQGGLMDVKKSPDFATSKLLYFTYTKDIHNQGATTLARAKLNGANLQNWRDLLITNSATSTTRHFGSRITFDKDGYLYFGIGDRGERLSSQDLSTHNGAIIRLQKDGKIPKDNPFINTPKAKDEIYSYGHRNPQGLIYDSIRDILWEIEHGPRGGDELNKILKGKNYGWPIIGYGKEYWGPIHVGEGTHKDGMEQPVKVYTPSIAPSSLMLYGGEAFPKWKGNLFAGALKLLHVNRIIVDNAGNVTGEERLLEDLALRIRQITQDENGYIYFSTDSGEIMRIIPQN